MNSKLVTVGIIVGLLGVGCSAAHRQARRLEGRFQSGQPPEEWQRVIAGGADRAWYNPALSATIYSDSNCAARFEDGELHDLIKHVTSGIARGEARSEEARVIDGREALVQVYDGSLDGVALRLGVLVTKKDECLYDFVYIAPPSRFEEGWPAFEQVTAGFSTFGS